MGQFQSKQGDVRAEVRRSVVGHQSRESRQPNTQEQSQKQQSSSPSREHNRPGEASVSKSTKKLQQSQMSTDHSYGQAEVQQSIVGNKYRESKQPKNQEQSEKQQSSSRDHSNLSKASVSKSTKKLQRSHLSTDSSYGEETLDKPMKKRVIPKIVVTGPFDDEMSSTSVDNLPESKTIRDIADSGSYNVHTKPSTIEAYQVRKEAA
ncbi:uncharacterized protein LOC120384651 [Mauremys reevesii]|uniref:uncharacterized protein LOC120384651 n=1 Tax=Mauremys reevesii TaxID=260615 RepID=UPI00193F8830|nr:uncharacterized protein LOC120384651 [Mauremys reevesii]